MENTVIILRGIPGNGKSTLAEYLNGLTDDAVICCADDYFTDDKGNYNFDASKLFQAHRECSYKFEEAVKYSKPLVILANTNTRTSDVNNYREMAIFYGYRVFVLTVENWHGGKDVHNVPEEAKERMKKQLMASIKLA